MHLILLLLFLSLVSCGPSDQPTDSFPTYPSSNPSILNGQVGDHSQFPSIVFLTKNRNSVSCSGSLIKPDLVLTAAHCTFLLSSSHEVVHGHNSMPDEDCDACFHQISGRKYPDSFSHTELNDDISIILLEQPIKGQWGQLISTNYQPLIQEDQILTIAGYGRDNDDDAGVLYYGDVPITSILSDQEMVLGEDDPDATNSCFGDSGGPAYLVQDGTQWITGVTSRVPDGFPPECGHGAIYVRPDAYLDWIETAYLELLEEREEVIPEDPPDDSEDDESEECCDHHTTTTTGESGCQMGSSSSYQLWLLFPLLFLIRRRLFYFNN